MLKYIKTEGGAFVLFSTDIQHDRMAAVVGASAMVSAGRAHKSADGSWHCFGASDSLGLESLSEDTEQLREWLP